MQHIVARTTGGGIGRQVNIYARNGIIKQHGINITAAIDGVITQATAQGIGTNAANQVIIARCAIKHVVARPTIKRIIARTPIKVVGAIAAQKGVVARIGPQGIVAIAAINHDIAIGQMIAGQIDHVIAITCGDGFDTINLCACRGFGYRIKTDGAHEIIAAVAALCAIAIRFGGKRQVTEGNRVAASVQHGNIGCAHAIAAIINRIPVQFATGHKVAVGIKCLPATCFTTGFPLHQVGNLHGRPKRIRAQIDNDAFALSGLAIMVDLAARRAAAIIANAIAVIGNGIIARSKVQLAVFIGDRNPEIIGIKPGTRPCCLHLIRGGRTG